jgi:hypothetical protein
MFSSSLDRIVFRQYEVQDVLRLLNTNKASGPDAIHAKLLKVAYDIISKPLCAIFNISLITKHFPNKWKLVNVTPSFAKHIRNIQKLIPSRVIYCKTRLMFCD